MYACICRAVTEDDVLSYVAGGARTTKDVQAACGAKPGCGACVQRIRALIQGTADGMGEAAEQLAPAG